MASQEPIYSPFFGVMGAASAIIFSGTYSWKFLKVKKKQNGRFSQLLSFKIPKQFTWFHSNDIIYHLPQLSEPPTEQPSPEQVSLPCQSWDLSWLWNPSSPLSWRVSLLSTVLSWRFSSLETSTSPDPTSTRYTSEFYRFFIASISSHVTDEKKINEITAHHKLCVLLTNKRPKLSCKCNLSGAM